MAQHNILGQWGEEQAARYLERKGFRIVERNWRDGHRDLDLVAVDEDTLVVVEVKTRRQGSLVEPELAVDRNKIRNVCRAANKYVKMKMVDLPIRFDIVAVTPTGAGTCDINHIEDAFLPIPF